MAPTRRRLIGSTGLISSAAGCLNNPAGRNPAQDDRSSDNQSNQRSNSESSLTVKRFNGTYWANAFDGDTGNERISAAIEAIDG
jgi:hypothetical protein